MAAPTTPESLRCVPWRLSYRTSMLKADGQPVDILHDFYLPALRRTVRYDRVAGYFRSTSLAAASQGFSAFVGSQGRMRLIVGADLMIPDIQAILAGTEERLTGALNAELAHPESWPEDVSRGVELLAWMVAHGYLEVRVAFRVHAQTGSPLAANSLADGYVHMKWAVFADAQGNRLYASGSLNESRTALTLNAENLDIHCDWEGERDRQRVDEAEQEFDRLWDNHNPSLRIFTLPEAVRQRLIGFADGITRPLEIDNTSAVPLDIPPPSALERLRFALLRDGPRLPGGRYVGLETAPITPWPHQAVVARRLIDTWPYSYLLCDEVGLGKTIEAGLAIRSLYLSGLVQRVMISAPGTSLTRQWQREMASKFYLNFGRALGGTPPRHEYIMPVVQDRAASSLYDPDLIIVSTGLVARRERRQELAAARPFDLVLVDEAHYVRRRNPTQGCRANPDYGRLYVAIRDGIRSKSRCLLLATATPMQIDPVEVADLLQLTRRVGAFQFDPSLMLAYYESLGKLTSHQTVTPEEWTFLRRAVQSVSDQDPSLWAFIEDAVIDGRMRLPARQWLEQGRVPRDRDVQEIQRLIFAASPLARVMLRHTRPLLDLYRAAGQLGANLAQRQILPIPRIVFTPQERQGYDQLETYCQGLSEQIRRQQTSRHRNALGFLLSFLRLRFASSLFAIHETLRRRLQRIDAVLNHLGLNDVTELDDIEMEDLLEDGDDDNEAVQALLRDRTPADLHWEQSQLRAMLATLSDLSGTPSKMVEVLRALDRRRLDAPGRFAQTVIFTRFYDTLTDIVERLLQAAPDMRLGTYSGRGGQYLEPGTNQLVAVDRDEVRHRFLRQDIDILVCTDAAAEGLNLQTADLLVNFDLPWNPMKVEQRIGRIDRIGQVHDRIYVLNLCYTDSAEQIVYGRLLQRLTQAGLIVGTQQLSLLPVTRDEFQSLAEGTLTATEVERLATERARRARRRMESMAIPPQELHRTYVRLEQQQHHKQAPVELDFIWETLSQSAYLHALGCQVQADSTKRLLTLDNIPDLPKGTALTASRATYEQGATELQGPLHFATYGDAAFEAVLDQLARFDLPACIRRLAVDIPDIPVTVIGYAIACKNGRGNVECRLVTSMRELDHLELHTEAHLTDAEVHPLRQSLSALGRQAYETTLNAQRIETLNEAAGESQQALNDLVMRGIILSRQRTGRSAPLIWRELGELEDLLQNPKTRLRVRHIPNEAARVLSGLLFDLTIPNTGEESHLDALWPLGLSALESAYRRASAMKGKRSELSTDDFLTRLSRAISGNAL